MPAHCFALLRASVGIFGQEKNIFGFLPPPTVTKLMDEENHHILPPPMVTKLMDQQNSLPLDSNRW